MASSKKSASKAAPKKSASKAAPKKSASKGAAKSPSNGASQKEPSTKEAKSNDFKTISNTSKPKHGQLVEIIASAPIRGVYNEPDGLVYVNGVGHKPLQFRPVAKGSIDESEQRAHESELHKMEKFAELDVPQSHRGENLHEQNPELLIDRNRQEIARREGSGKRALETTLYGENANEQE